MSKMNSPWLPSADSHAATSVAGGTMNVAAGPLVDDADDPGVDDVTELDDVGDPLVLVEEGAGAPV